MGSRDRFYLRQLDTIDGIDVWRVDGHRVRDELDVEFTNGHHHFTRPYIPNREIWLDREAQGGEEWRLWAQRQVSERWHMQRGKSYLTALRIGANAERKSRRELVGPDAPTHRVTAREMAAIARRRRLGTAAGKDVWVIDGCAVRDLAYVDFTMGGHGYRYRFVPKTDIWLDDAVTVAERPAILHHEAVEVGHMAGGMRYDEAHALASEAERLFRRASRRRALAR